MIRPILVILIALVLLPISASANPRAKNKMSISGGMGFTASPTSFLINADFQYQVSDNISFGPTFQVAPTVSPFTTLVALDLDARYYVPLKQENKLVPYVGLGLGFRTFTNGGGTDFLLPFILGAEYDLTDEIALTTDMRFNITSGFDNFYYSWQIVGARLRF